MLDLLHIFNFNLIVTFWAQLLEAWLVLTRVKYHDNL